MSTNGNGKTERVYSSSEMNAVTPEQNRARLRPFVDGIDRASDWMEPQKHSQLSAAQRAKLTDDMVAAIQEQRRQINVLTQTITNQRRVAEILDQRLAESQRLAWAQETQLNAHSSILQRPTLWGRLKWFWTGR